MTEAAGDGFVQYLIEQSYEEERDFWDDEGNLILTVTANRNRMANPKMEKQEMITSEDMDAFREDGEPEDDKSTKKHIVIDTMQFFNMEMPRDMDPDEFLYSEECRKACAESIINGDVELLAERVLLKYNKEKGSWE